MGYQKHTKEPWYVNQECQCGHEGCHYTGVSSGSFYQGTGFSPEDAARIVDCVNALAGIDKPSLYVGQVITRTKDKVLEKVIQILEDAQEIDDVIDDIRALKTSHLLTNDK